MGRKKGEKEGKRISVWIPPKQLETAKQIQNLSRFFQIALDTAPDIMAWAILKEREPAKYDTGNTLDEHIDEFNKRHPPNELTQKRNGTWHKSSQSKQELW